MTTTFRAAFVPAEPGSNGAGILLTTEDNAHLSDDQLIALARAEAASGGVTGAIEIGEWRE